eukprot:COSAG02_NODE_20166_length_845_cov_22.985255_1_plen_46_part_10
MGRRGGGGGKLRWSCGVGGEEWRVGWAASGACAGWGSDWCKLFVFM